VDEAGPCAPDGEEYSLGSRALAEFLDAAVQKGVPFRFRARGGSMFPFIRDGDVLTIRPLGDAPPAPGSVAAFARPGTGRLVVHRIVRREADTFLVRGDNLSAPDPPVPAENLLGTVTGIERRGRPVRFGLGPERALIARLPVRALTRVLAVPVRRLIRGLRRKRA